MSRAISAPGDLKLPRRITVAHVVRDLLRFIKEIKCKPALLRSTDPSFILDRVRDLCHPNSRKEVSLGSLPDELLRNCLRYLGPEDMLSMGRVCRNFLKLANYSEHWKCLLPLEFPVPQRNNFDYRTCYLRMKKKPNSLIAAHPSVQLEGLRATFVGSSPVVDGLLVKANNPVKFASLYYFEVRIENAMDSKVSIGFISDGYPQMHPGYYPLSYAYHSDSGCLFNNSDERNWGPSFDDGDCIGCGFHPASGSVFFTKNSDLLGMPFPIDTSSEEALFPAVGLQSPGQIVYMELGADPEAFVFPIHELDAMPPAILRRFDSFSDLDYGSDYGASESSETSLDPPQIQPESSYLSSRSPAISESPESEGIYQNTESDTSSEGRYGRQAEEFRLRSDRYSDSSYGYQDPSSEDYSEHVPYPPAAFFSHRHSPPSEDLSSRSGLREDLEQLIERLEEEGPSMNAQVIDFLKSALQDRRDR